MTYRAAVITVSYTCYHKGKEDLSGPALAGALKALGIEISHMEIVPDDHSMIINVLQKAIGSEAHLIMTTGGTGFSPSDVTPEATRQLIERPAPGIAEILRQEGASQTPLSWLSRGEAGIVRNKLIINLPGSTKAMVHSVEVLKPLLFHALDLLNGKKPH
jgi:molybdopterin adenylyltransferase